MSAPLNISHNIHTQTPITKETSLSGTNVKLNNVSCITLEHTQKNLDDNKSDYAEAKTESKDVEGGKVTFAFEDDSWLLTRCDESVWEMMPCRLVPATITAFTMIQ